MDLETISLISEPVSAFALLLTLYFLFKQIKLQTKALEKIKQSYEIATGYCDK